MAVVGTFNVEIRSRKIPVTVGSDGVFSARAAGKNLSNETLEGLRGELTAVTKTGSRLLIDVMARLKAATLGPWEAAKVPPGTDAFGRSRHEDLWEVRVTSGSGRRVALTATQGDAEMIAHARDDLPRMLSKLERTVEALESIVEIGETRDVRVAEEALREIQASTLDYRAARGVAPPRVEGLSAEGAIRRIRGEQ